MALRSADSPNGSQPIISCDSERYRESERKGWIGPISLLLVLATIEAAVAFHMGFTCSKAYMSSTPDLGITGYVKKTIFIVFLLCNSIPMLTSVVAVMLLIGAKLSSELVTKFLIFFQALVLVQIAFLSILFAFLVRVCLMVNL